MENDVNQLVIRLPRNQYHVRTRIPFDRYISATC